VLVYPGKLFTSPQSLLRLKVDGRLFRHGKKLFSNRWRPDCTACSSHTAFKCHHGRVLLAAGEISATPVSMTDPAWYDTEGEEYMAGLFEDARRIAF
jgi:hypothetical protein